MLISFVYALTFLLLIPYLFGFESLGIFGMIMGCLGAWIVIWIGKEHELTQEQDSEIIGTYVTQARYYEPWTEKIKHEDEETGKITYETVEHDEEWEIDVAEGGQTIAVDEEDYRYYVGVFGNEEEEEADHYGEAEGEIIDPGYCHITRWPGTFQTACYEYVRRNYKNPTLRASNVYTAESLSEQDIKDCQLEEYGRKGLYGTVKGDDVEYLENEIRDYNCWMRETNIKLNFILLENVQSSRATVWQRYWQNGKRNTINAVVGIDNEHKIQWAHVFGWQNEATCIKLRDFIMGLTGIEDIALSFDKVREILQENYKLPDFGQYEFVQGSFPLKGTLIALTICLGIFCTLFCRPPQLNERAQQKIKQGQYQLAKSDLQEYLVKHPENPYALNNLGVLLFKEKLYQEAEEMFSQAVKHQYVLPREMLSDLYKNRAICYNEMKQYKNAIKNYKEAVDRITWYSSGKEYYCGLYNLYKKLGYKNSIWALNEKYHQLNRGTLKEVCTHHKEDITFLYEDVDPMQERGITDMIHNILYGPKQNEL